MAEQHKKRKNSDRLLLVQSIVCGVVLLIALIVRLIGGGFYQTLRTEFRNALTDGGFTEQVMAWFYPESTDD